MAKNLKYAALLDIYENMLTDKQRNILDLYYNEDLSLAEISENLGISRQGAMDMIHRAEAQIDSMDSKLNLSAIFDNIDSACEMLKELSDKSDSKDLKLELNLILNKLAR